MKLAWHHARRVKEAEAGYEASRLVTCVEADGFIVATKIICTLFVATLEEKSKFYIKGPLRMQGWPYCDILTPFFIFMIGQFPLNLSSHLSKINILSDTSRYDHPCSEV